MQSAILGFIFSIVFVGLIGAAYLYKFRADKSRHGKLSTAGSRGTSSYKVKYLDQTYFGSLTVSKDGLEYKDEFTSFTLQASEIEKIVYGKYALQIIAHSGRMYPLNQLHDSPRKAGVVLNNASYGWLAHSALPDFINAVQSLKIPTEEGELPKPQSYYHVIYAIVVSGVLIGLLIIADLVFHAFDG